MSHEDLALVLAWRNHEDLRRCMYTQHEISLAEHTQWFERASRESARRLMIFELEGVPNGFVNMNGIGPGRIADWGFYTAPDAPRGAGYKLGSAALGFVFRDNGAHKLCGQVLGHNSRSIAFHRKLGFRQEGLLRDQHFDGERYYDIVCFGLLASEWRIIS